MTPQQQLVAAVKAWKETLVPSDASPTSYYFRKWKVLETAEAFVDSLEKGEAKCEECERLRAALVDGVELLSNYALRPGNSFIEQVIGLNRAALAAPAKATEAK